MEEERLPAEEKTVDASTHAAPQKQLRTKLHALFHRHIPQRQKIIILVALLGFGGLGLLAILVNQWTNYRLPFSQPFSNQAQLAAQKPPEGFTKLEIPERSPSFFTLSPQTTSLFGILPRETFILKTKQPVDPSQVSQLLSSSVDLTIEPRSETEFELKPANAFAKNQNVVIKIAAKGQEIGGETLDRNYSWAFQTQADFQLESTIPGNQATNVPINTGIEFTFNQDGFQPADAFVSISPSIEYQLEAHDQTLAIVPLKPLQPQTTYTVRLRRGFGLQKRNDALDEDVVISFQTQEPPEQKSTAYLSPTDSYIQHTPRDQTQIKVDTRNWQADMLVSAEVFQFDSIPAFVESRQAVDAAESSWWNYYADTDVVSTTDLTSILTADLTVQRIEAEPKAVDYLQLPEALPIGLYLVELTYADDKKAQVWVQSTFLSAYVNVGRRETLVWLNTIDQADPVSLATISMVGSGQRYQTDTQGVATFATPENFFGENRSYLEARTGDDRWVVIPVDSLQHRTSPSQIARHDYWSYLYHERDLYRPGETVHFWGVIKDRNTNQPPTSVSIGVTKGYYYYGDSKPVEAIAQVQVSPQANGTFIGELTLPEGKTGWYNLSLLIDDQVIAASSLSLTQFVKPELKLEVTTDKKAIFAGESVNHQIQVSFFDGTPASKLPINVSGRGGWGEDKTIEADTQGRAQYQQTTTYEGNAYRWYPRYEGISFFPGTAQDKIVEGYGSVRVFGSEYLMDIDRQQDKAQAKFTATLNRVDLGPFNRGETNEVRGGRVADTDIQMIIEKTWYERVEQGTYYDFIEKVTRPRYTYQRRSEQVVNSNLRTDTNGQVSYEFELEQNKSYRVDLSATDSGGRTESQSTYFYYSSGSNDYHSYQSTKPALSLQNEDNHLAIGEEIDLEIHQNDSLLETSDQTRILYTIAQEGRQRFIISSDPYLKLPFSQEHIPNITLGALIYDGRTYQQASGDCNWMWSCGDYYYNGNRRQLQYTGLNIEYDQTQSQLDVEISSNQSKYQPGDTASVSVKVTQNDQPVAGATVNLAVVDQALAAIGGVVEPSILSSLYTYVPVDMYYLYYSHQLLVPDPSQAERGGGGGDERQVFKDTPYFGVATTDENGQANISFTLPDNITTWLMYAQAVTTDLDAGHSSFSIPATLDFFITSNYPSSILSQDKPQVALSSYGVGLDGQPTANYQVLLQQSDQTLKDLTATAPVFTETGVDLTSIQSGNYQLISRGESQGFADGIAKPLNVVDSRLQLTLGENYSLKAGESISSLKSENVAVDEPVKFIITDAGKGQYYQRLMQLCYVSSNRVEKMLARQTAAPLVDEYFEADDCPEVAQEMLSFQNDDGGIGLVKWASSDLGATTWSTYVAADTFDQARLEAFFTAKLNNPNSDTLEQIQAAWGLALLGETQTLKLQALANQAVTFSQQSLAAIALASIGSTEEAREMFLDLMAEHAYQKLDTIRLEDPQGSLDPINDRYLVDTSHALLLSSLLDSAYAREMYKYITTYRTNLTDQVLDLAEIAYIKQALSILPNEATQVSLEAGGIRTDRTITLGRSQVMQVPTANASDFNLAVIFGAADVLAQYQVASQAISEQKTSPFVSLEREYYNVTAGNTVQDNRIQVGDIIQVKLQVEIDKDQAPLGCYMITDILPSGFRYLDRAYRYGLSGASYFGQVEDQVFQTCVYNSDWWQHHGSRTLSYYVRAAHLGEYQAEPALIQSHQELSIFNFSDRATVTISSQSE